MVIYIKICIIMGFYLGKCLNSAGKFISCPNNYQQQICSTFFSSQFLGILDEHRIKDELDYIFSFSSFLNVFIFLILTFRSICNDFYFLFYILTYSDISFFYRVLSAIVIISTFTLIIYTVSFIDVFQIFVI